MAMSVEKGDFISITPESKDLRTRFGYVGKMKPNMIAKVGRVAVTNHNFRVEGEEDGMGTWLNPRHVDVLEPTTLQHISDETHSHVLAVEDGDDITAGKMYKLERDFCDDLGFYDDDGDFRDGWHIKLIPVTQEQYDATHGIVAPAPVVEAPTAEVIPFPTPIRTKFSDMSDAERGALLLAHHEGKTIQYFEQGFLQKWAEGEVITWNPRAIYRVKPQALIDAEKEVVTLQVQHKDAVVDLDEKRAELKALEEKAGDISDQVDKAQQTVRDLLAA